MKPFELIITNKATGELYSRGAHDSREAAEVWLAQQQRKKQYAKPGEDKKTISHLDYFNPDGYEVEIKDRTEEIARNKRREKVLAKIRDEEKILADTTIHLLNKIEFGTEIPVEIADQRATARKKIAKLNEELSETVAQ